MEEILEEVTKKSISIRGTWAKQISGGEPDFSGLKFSVKCSDKSTLKYDSWESFQSEGGDYSIQGSKRWAASEGMQDIIFYLDDCPEVSLTKSVKIVRVPVNIEVTPSGRIYESGDEISSADFSFRIRYNDNSVKDIDSLSIGVIPNVIPLGYKGDFNVSFEYTENDDKIYHDYVIKVLEKSYTIEALRVNPDIAESKIVLMGKEMSEVTYRYQEDYDISIKVRARSLKGRNKFLRWVASTDKVYFEDTKEIETTLVIPAKTYGNIWVIADWDKSLIDDSGNEYTVEDGALKSVKIVSDKAVIPEGVTLIEKDVFKDSSLSEVILPESLITIREGSFENCVNLTEIVIPPHVETIGESSFKNCKSLCKLKTEGGHILIGNEAFYGCESLKEVDFLSMGDDFINCVFGDTETRNVWEGCRLRTVKITKGNFLSDLGSVESSSPVTIRVPYAFEANMKSKSDTIRARVIGTTANGSNKGISRDITRSNAYCKKFDRTLTEDSLKLETYRHTKNYDMRESCGCYLIGGETTQFNVSLYGLGHKDFNYNLYVKNLSGYDFTVVGNDRFFSEGEIGEGFSNWNMRGYVNNVLYPNIKTSEGYSLINLMIPLYHKEKF